LATSAWHVAQTSEPTKSAGFSAAAFVATAAFLFPLAAYTRLETPGNSAINAIHIKKRFIQPSAEASGRFALSSDYRQFSPVFVFTRFEMNQD
jgi:hypothetical protein